MNMPVPQQTFYLGLYRRQHALLTTKELVLRLVNIKGAIATDAKCIYSCSMTHASYTYRWTTSDFLFVAKGYSKRGAMTITEAHHTSPKALYDHKWKAFEGYCQIHDITTPTTASPPQVATYLAEINSMIATTTGWKVSMVAELQALIPTELQINSPVFNHLHAMTLKPSYRIYLRRPMSLQKLYFLTCHPQDGFSTGSSNSFTTYQSQMSKAFSSLVLWSLHIS